MGIEIYAQCHKKNVEASAVPLKDIAVFSQKEYSKWEQLPHFDFAFERKGMLEIFQTEKVGHHAAQTVEAGKKLGLDVELVDEKGLKSWSRKQQSMQRALFILNAIHTYIRINSWLRSKGVCSKKACK